MGERGAATRLVAGGDGLGFGTGLGEGTAVARLMAGRGGDLRFRKLFLCRTS